MRRAMWRALIGLKARCPVTSGFENQILANRTRFANIWRANPDEHPVYSSILCKSGQSQPLYITLIYIQIIIASSKAGSFSVGAIPYLDQGYISLISCSASMLITILSLIKLYLNINDNLQSESDMARKFMYYH